MLVALPLSGGGTDETRLNLLTVPCHYIDGTDGVIGVPTPSTSFALRERPPVRQVIGAHIAAELLGGAARGPVIVDNEAVTQVSRAVGDELEISVRAERDAQVPSAL